MNQLDLAVLLAQCANCQFVSDLPSHYNDLNKYEVSQISEDMFSVKEWNNILAYIFGADFDFTTTFDAKSYLISRLV